ncbi:MAG: SDR family NAD(P)-dependent oxidoreductase [Gemmatimonadales bacterium]
MSTAGRTILLTGASRGLGALMARAFAARGHRLALAARSEAPLVLLARELAAQGATAVPIVADVSAETDRVRLVAEAERVLGRIDVLVNNAGVESGAAFATQDPAVMRQILLTNVEGPMLLARAVLPAMLARHEGQVVNIASLAGKLGLPFASVYGASKAAIIAWSRALRLELEGSGVTVSVVSPGYVAETGMWAEHGRAPHWLTGESRPEAVVKGVLRALDRRDAEVIVNPRPFRPMLVLHALAPGLVESGLRKAGFIDFARAVQGD